MYSILVRKKDNVPVGATLFTKGNAFFAQWKEIESLGEKETKSGTFEHKSSFANEELATEAWGKLKKEIK